MFAKPSGPWVTVFALSALFFMSLSVNADVDTGVRAYKDEDYPTAYTEFLAAAVAGNAVAQYLVGLCTKMAWARHETIVLQFVGTREPPNRAMLKEALHWPRCCCSGAV